MVGWTGAAGLFAITEVLANDEGEVFGAGPVGIDDKVVGDADVHGVRLAGGHAGYPIPTLGLSGGRDVRCAADTHPADHDAAQSLLPALLSDGATHEVVLYQNVRTRSGHGGNTGPPLSLHLNEVSSHTDAAVSGQLQAPEPEQLGRRGLDERVHAQSQPIPVEHILQAASQCGLA
jgi:hypothetical protein